LEALTGSGWQEAGSSNDSQVVAATQIMPIGRERERSARVFDQHPRVKVARNTAQTPATDSVRQRLVPRRGVCTAYVHRRGFEVVPRCAHRASDKPVIAHRLRLVAHHPFRAMAIRGQTSREMADIHSPATMAGTLSVLDPSFVSGISGVTSNNDWLIQKSAVV
jgi:hypothetical protein